MEEKAVLNRQDLKELLGVKNLRLRALISQGLPHIKLNAERGCFVFLKSSVLIWLKSMEQNSIYRPHVKEVETDSKVKLAMPK